MHLGAIKEKKTILISVILLTFILRTVCFNKYDEITLHFLKLVNFNTIAQIFNCQKYYMNHVLLLLNVHMQKFIILLLCLVNDFNPRSLYTITTIKARSQPHNIQTAAAVIIKFVSRYCKVAMRC